MLRKNTLKDAFTSKTPQFGCFMKFSDADSAEMIGQIGYDFCVVDAEHATFAPREITHILRTCDLVGMPCIIRTPGLNSGFMLSVLDSGAAGVQVPNIDTKEQAEALVSHAKYMPEGTRGFAPTTRAAGFGQGLSPAEYAQFANDIVVTVAHCESRQSVENLDSILTVPGLDVVFVGPMDLSQSYGKLGQTGDPEVKSAIEGALTRTAAAGKAPGFICGASMVPYYRDLGVLYFLLGADQGFMSSAARQALETAKKAL